MDVGFPITLHVKTRMHVEHEIFKIQYVIRLWDGEGLTCENYEFQEVKPMEFFGIRWYSDKSW